MARMTDGALAETGEVLIELDASGNGSAEVGFREAFVAAPQVQVRRIAGDTATVTITPTLQGFTVAYAGSIIRSETRRLSWQALEDA